MAEQPFDPAGDPQQFRLFVVRSLTRLENEMQQLTGNGQPGRVGLLERKTRLHDRFIWMLSGALGLAGAGIGWLMSLLGK